MFDIHCLKDEPLILEVSDIKEECFEHPRTQDVSHSNWMTYAMDEDGIEMIYAMQCRPWFNYIAFKVKYRDDQNPHSEIILNPELHMLKRIWDLGHKDFNNGISFYCKYSPNLVYQFSHKENFPQNIEAWNWYKQMMLGRLD